MSNTNDKQKSQLDELNLIREALLSHQQVIGDKLYFRVPRNNGTLEALPIESKELKDYMTRYLIDEYGFILNRNSWETVKSYVLGDIPSSVFSNKANRIAIKDDTIYYDLHNEYDKVLSYIEIKDGDWSIQNGDTEMFWWNQFSKEQVLPNKEQGDYLLLEKYLNLRNEDMLLALVYIASCFIPGHQHPILNISGEQGTGKSTISKIIKALIDPVKGSSLSNFSDEKDGLEMQLAQFYLTVFDNTENLKTTLNSVFCQAVTGGVTYKRKFYTQDTLVPTELRSIVILNGITSGIRKEDLLSRTVFVETLPLPAYDEANKIEEEFEEDLPKILGGVLTVVAKALQIKAGVKLSASYRMMEFTTLGYAIAESIGDGLGEKFMEAMKRNEQYQLREMKKNEPLINVFQNFLKINHDGVCWPVGKVYKDIVRNDIYHAGLGDSVKELPKGAPALSRKVNALKSMFLKYGIIAETGTIPSNDYHTLTITYAENEETPSPKTDDSVQQEIIKARGKIIRKPILGIRKPII